MLEVETLVELTNYCTKYYKHFQQPFVDVSQSCVQINSSNFLKLIAVILLNDLSVAIASYPYNSIHSCMDNYNHMHVWVRTYYILYVRICDSYIMII